MGNFFGGGNAEDEEEEMEQERLKRWRPASEHQQLAALRRKKVGDKHSEGSEDGSGSGSASDAGSGGSSSVGAPDSEDSGDERSQQGADETKSQDSKGDGASSSDASEGDGEKEAVEKLEEKRKKKLVVHMEFEPLLSLHEPLGALLEEPADIWANAKNTRKQNRIEKAAIEDALAANRNKAKAVAEWMAEMGLEDCMLNEAADAIEEEPDELRYALNASKHFEVDDRDGVVRKTLLQQILDCMDSDIETVQEVIEKLVNSEADEDMVRKAVQDSGGELRLKYANDVELIEHVNIEAETKQKRIEEKESRLRAKEDKRKTKGKKGRRGSLASRLSRGSDDSAAEGGDDSDSDSDEGTSNTQNKEAERKALAFRRLQVQRKIEDFLWLYRNGQNLQKINSKGRRYNRRVYIDTSKRALVIQGASGPSFFPFINMKEIDIDTHTTKEGRVETHVICAMEKNGRIYKELVLAFPDQAKANNFVNSMTLFSLALRSAASR